MKENDKNRELNKLAVKAGFFYVVTQLAVRGITFFSTPIYTRLVDTAQYGQLRVYESWLVIFVPIMSLGLFRSVDKAKYDYPDKYDDYVSSVQSLSYISISVFFVVFLFFYNRITDFLGINALLFGYMFLYIMGYTSTLYYQRREKQKMQYKEVAFITVVTMFPATVFSILFLYLGNRWRVEDKLVELRVVGYYTPQILVGLILAVMIIKKGKCLYNKQYWQYGLLYSIPLIPEQISIQIMNQMDKIMIQKMVDSYSAGLFALGTTVSYIMWIIEDSVWGAWQPWLYEKISRDEEKDIEKPWLIIAFVFGVVSIMAVLVAPEIVLFLGGAGYTQTSYLIAPMLMGTWFRILACIYSSMQNYYMKTKYVAYGTIVTMLVNVVLNYICILKWGYQTAAYTTAFSYFILMIVQGILEKRVTGKRVVSMWKMIILAIVVTMLSILSMQTFELLWLIRWGIAITIGGIMLLKLFPLIKKTKKYTN